MSSHKKAGGKKPPTQTLSHPLAVLHLFNVCSEKCGEMEK
jgi:hypothetical protein